MPPQEILTRDSVTINVDAVVYYQVNTVNELSRSFAMREMQNFSKILLPAAVTSYNDCTV